MRCECFRYNCQLGGHINYLPLYISSRKLCQRNWLLFSNSNFLFPVKELILCHLLWFSNIYIFATWWCKPLIFQTKFIWSNRIHGLDHLRSTTLGWKDIGLKNQSLWQILNSLEHNVVDLWYLKQWIQLTTEFKYKRFTPSILSI